MAFVPEGQADRSQAEIAPNFLASRHSGPHLINPVRSKLHRLLRRRDCSILRLSRTSSSCSLRFNAALTCSSLDRLISSFNRLISRSCSTSKGTHPEFLSRESPIRWSSGQLKYSSRFNGCP